MVIPTIGALVYLLLVPNIIPQHQRYYLLGLLFITTYFIPLLILVLLKIGGFAQSFHLSTIKERKIPLFLMMLLFYVLGNSLSTYREFYDFTLLFYSSTLALLAVYLFFSVQIKVSLHLTSMGIITGFFMAIGITYSVSTLPIVLVFIALSGLLASSRLHLKAHEPQEVYIGFLLGLCAPLATFYLL